MLKFLKNKFVIILIGFAVWMLFFDSNSLMIHNDLNKENDAKEAEIEHYKKGILKDSKEYNKLKSEEGLEKFAREEYYMKRENEDIYIIEYQDSLKVKEDE